MLTRRTPIVLTLAVLFTLGCAQAPTSPEPSTPESTTAAQPADLRSGPADAAPQGLLGGIIPIATRLVVRTLNVVGSVGGSLSNGRWQVDVPAGAVEGSATISLSVSSLTSPDCHLEIAPLSKNQFSVPVTLTADCRGVPADELAKYVIYWYNPALETWVPVSGSKVDLTQKTVSAELEHFSRYAVGPVGGRSGW